MTFIVDNRLSIEIFDLIKSRGGKITVYKELTIVENSKGSEEEEPEYSLRSLVYPEGSWEDGWNYAECDEELDPIPLVVTTGHAAGPGMFHAWLNDGKFRIPFEARLEDFHFAGYAPGGLFQTNLYLENREIHMGFKKLYLYKVDKELGVKMLLGKRGEAEEEPRIMQAFQATGLLATPHYNQLQQQLNSAQQMFGLSYQQSALAQTIGGIGGAYGTPAALDFYYPHFGSSWKTATECLRRVYRGIGRVFGKTGRPAEPDNSEN